MPWPCFWVEPVDRETRFLRRYKHEDSQFWSNYTQGDHLHNTTHQIPDGSVRWTEPKEHGIRYHRTDADGFMDYGCWPTHCECGYEFKPDDSWQVMGDIYFGRPGTDPWTGEVWPMADLPIGAMFNAWWFSPYGAWTGPDGIALTVKLPPGGQYDYWHIDGPSASGGHWTRTGTPPNITAAPSILTPNYHGFLQNGVLTDPI